MFKFRHIEAEFIFVAALTRAVDATKNLPHAAPPKGFSRSSMLQFVDGHYFVLTLCVSPYSVLSPYIISQGPNLLCSSRNTNHFPRSFFLVAKYKVQRHWEHFARPDLWRPDLWQGAGAERMDSF